MTEFQTYIRSIERYGLIPGHLETLEQHFSILWFITMIVQNDEPAGINSHLPHQHKIDNINNSFCLSLHVSVVYFVVFLI